MDIDIELGITLPVIFVGLDNIASFVLLQEYCEVVEFRAPLVREEFRLA